MTGTEEFEAIYGPAAKHADHKAGETIRFWDRGQPGGQNRGEILHRVEATEKNPLVYVVTPEIGLFPIEVAVHEVIEYEVIG